MRSLPLGYPQRIRDLGNDHNERLCSREKGHLYSPSSRVVSRSENLNCFLVVHGQELVATISRVTRGGWRAEGGWRGSSRVPLRGITTPVHNTTPRGQQRNAPQPPGRQAAPSQAAPSQAAPSQAAPSHARYRVSFLSYMAVVSSFEFTGGLRPSRRTRNQCYVA